VGYILLHCPGITAANIVAVANKPYQTTYSVTALGRSFKCAPAVQHTLQEGQVFLASSDGLLSPVTNTDGLGKLLLKELEADGSAAVPGANKLKVS